MNETRQAQKIKKNGLVVFYFAPICTTWGKEPMSYPKKIKKNK
jgi:hypothetical protein